MTPIIVIGLLALGAAELPVVSWLMEVSACAGGKCNIVRRNMGGRFACQAKQAAIMEAVPGTPPWILGHPTAKDVTVTVVCKEVRGQPEA